MIRLYGSKATGMVHERRLQAGFVASTEYAREVSAYFEGRGVPVSKLSINDEPAGEGRLEHVCVQEGRGVNLTPDEFSRYRTALNDLQHSHDGTKFNRWDESETTLLVAYDHPKMSESEPQTPKEAGEQLENPEALESSYQPGRWEVRDSSSADSDTAYVYDTVSNAVYAVKFAGFETEVHALATQTDLQDNNKKRDIIGAAIVAGPSVRQTPESVISLRDVQVASGGGSSGAAPAPPEASDGGGDDGGEVTGEVEWVADPGITDYDAEELEAKVDDWLSNYASVKTDLIDGAWHVEFAEMNDRNGNSELGVYIRSDPWDGPLWDSSSNSFDTDDGKRPDEWADHSTAFRSIMSDEDGPTKAVVDDEPEYNDYYNYIPADKVADL